MASPRDIRYNSNSGRLIIPGVSETAPINGPAAGTRTTSPSPRYGKNRNNGSGNVVDQGYRFASNRQRLPTQAGSAITSATEYLASSLVFYSPSYAQTDIRIMVTNFYVDQTGAAIPEKQNTSNRIIEGASIEIGGTKYQFTFNGQAGITMDASTPYAWSDPLPNVILPADTTFKVITADHVPVGGFRPSGYRPSNTHGDRYTYGTTSQASFLTTGTPGTPTSGVFLSGPGAIVGKPVGVTPKVPLVIGDSIAHGANEDTRASSARGVYGWISRGLDDATGGRMTYGMFAIPGTRLSNLANTDGEWKIRKAALAAVGNPFSSIICEMGVNSVDGQPNLNGRFDAAMAFVRTIAGTKKIIQTTLSPKTSDSGNNVYSTVASQVVNTDNIFPTGQRWVLNEYIKTKPANVDEVIDVTPYWIDATAKDKFKSMGRESTLAADVSSGTSISVNGTSPIVGDQIIIGAGASGPIDREVTAVSGAGPYTVTLRTAITGSYLTGATVRATPTVDGVHPTTALHVEASAAIIAAKALIS